MPGPSDGFHCDRDRLVWTKTVSGWPLRMFQMPDACQPFNIPPSPCTPGMSTEKFTTQLCRVSKSDKPLLYPGMYSGNAVVVPFVASEKNVDAWVVSSLFDSVYDDCSEKPWLNLRRTSMISALYQDSPSLLFNSIVEKLVFGRGVPNGMKTLPSDSVVGGAVFTSLLRYRF